MIGTICGIGDLPRRAESAERGMLSRYGDIHPGPSLVLPPRSATVTVRSSGALPVGRLLQTA
jgi:hypothetical protein